jgi:hypothetical protein
MRRQPAGKLQVHILCGEFKPDGGDGTGKLNIADWTTHIQLQQGPLIVRVRASDGRVTPVASLKDVRQVLAPDIGPWLGVRHIPSLICAP